MSTNPFAAPWKQFKGETACHSLSVLHADGLYRHLRMAAPGTSVWYWDVITWPGHLCIDGDIGDGLVFSREDDMIEFFRAGLKGGTYDDGAPQISVGYWAEKLSRGAGPVKSYSPSRFLGCVQAALIERGGKGDYAKFMAIATDVAEDEHKAREWLKEERRMFGGDAYWDWELTGWDHHFILSCYAIAATVRAVI